MQMPFSDIPQEAVYAKVEMILQKLGSLERLLAYSGASLNTNIICQTLMLLLPSIRSELQETHEDTVLRVRSAIEQLKPLAEK